ncbi:protein ORF96 [Cyprinid herpesvirus 3]|nr:protein ORF96 [Cyprinid herpesvirus 3]
MSGMRKLRCPLCTMGISLEGLVSHMITTHNHADWTVSCGRCRATLNTCPVPFEQQSGFYAWLHVNVPNHPCYQANLAWTFTDTRTAIGSPVADGKSVKVMRDRCDAYKLGGAKRLPQSLPQLGPYLLVPKKTAASHGLDEEVLLGGFDLHDAAVRKTFSVTNNLISAWSAAYNGTTYVDLDWPELVPSLASRPFCTAVQKWRSVVKETGLAVQRFKASIPQRPAGLTACTECGPNSAHSCESSCTRWASCVGCGARFEWGYPTCECSAKCGGDPIAEWCDWCDVDLDHGLLCGRPEPVFVPFSLSWIPDSVASDVEQVRSLIKKALCVSSSSSTSNGQSTDKRCECPNCVALAALLEGRVWDSAQSCLAELRKKPNLTCPRERARFYPIPHLHYGNPANYGSSPLAHAVKFPGDQYYDVEGRTNVWLRIKSVNAKKKKTLVTAGPGGFNVSNVWSLDEAFLAAHPGAHVVLVATDEGWCCVLSLPAESARRAYPRHRWAEWMCPRTDFKVTLRATPLSQLSHSFVTNFVPNSAFKAYGRTVPKGWIRMNLSQAVQHEHSPDYSGQATAATVSEPTDKVKTAVKRYYQTLGSEYREHRRQAKALAALSRTLNCDTLTVDPHNPEPYTSVAKLLDDDSQAGALRCDPSETDSYMVLRDYMQPADPRAPRLEPEKIQELCLRADEVGPFVSGDTSRAVLMFAASRHGIFPAWDLDRAQWLQLSRACGHSLLARTVLRYYNRFALCRCLPCLVCEKEPQHCKCVLPRCLLCNVGLHGPWACELLVKPSVPFFKLSVDLRLSSQALPQSSQPSQPSSPHQNV